MVQWVEKRNTLYKCACVRSLSFSPTHLCMFRLVYIFILFFSFFVVFTFAVMAAAAATAIVILFLLSSIHFTALIFYREFCSGCCYIVAYKFFHFVPYFCYFVTIHFTYSHYNTHNIDRFCKLFSAAFFCWLNAKISLSAQVIRLNTLTHAHRLVAVVDKTIYSQSHVHVTQE